MASCRTSTAARSRAASPSPASTRSSAGPGELARAVGYVAQDPETQVVSTTVAAELALPLEMRGEPRLPPAAARSRRSRSPSPSRTFSTAPSTRSPAVSYSVWHLAAALVTRPQLVLLDEPTSQLDPVAGDELIWLLRRLNEEWGVTILLAEHRLERCLAAADRVIAMDSGTIGFDGCPRDFLSWAQHNDPALETPGARLFSLAGIQPLPTGVRDARRILGRVVRRWGDLRSPETAEGEARAKASRNPFARSSAKGRDGAPPPRQARPPQAFAISGSSSKETASHGMFCAG